MRRLVLLAVILTGVVSLNVLLYYYIKAQPSGGEKGIYRKDYERLELEEILKRHAEASGGLAAQLELKSLRLTGRFEIEGQGFPARLVKKSPDLARFSIEMPSGDYLMVHDGETVWEQHPGKPPHLLDTRMARAFEEEAPLTTPLTNPGLYDAALEQEEGLWFSGRYYYRVKATLPSGLVKTYWIDGDTFLESKVVSYEKERENAETEILLSDYRTVEVMEIPHRIVSLKNGQRQYLFTVESVELNPGILSGYFEYPFDEDTIETLSGTDH